MRVLVAVDGSAESLRAVGHAVELVRHSADPELVLASVQNHRTMGLSDVAAPIGHKGERQLAETLTAGQLAEAARLCWKAGIPVTTKVELGPIAAGILKLARREKADQIVMGTRRLGTLKGAFTGSIAAQVIRGAKIPVTIVK